MPLTKSQIIEIQESAKFNHLKRLREIEEKKQLEETIAEKVAEQVKPKSVQKGK